MPQDIGPVTSVARLDTPWPSLEPSLMRCCSTPCRATEGKTATNHETQAALVPSPGTGGPAPPVGGAM
ncbi:hypothetical protein, partial [Verrucomicrobium spinosum]|uniref:hypothetical protein n=1 Tax=Verrucomicrobium spinosum TaxID=2736 RepID=UPI001C437444